MFLRLKLKDHQEIKRLILAADRSYKKHDASFRSVESVTLSGTYWDGGSRSTYHAVRLSDGYCLGAPQYNPPQFGGPQTDPHVEIPQGVAIVETGTFCGKTATACVYCNPSDVAKLLPAP